MVISGLKYRNYYANRNENNKRLDTNITSMFSPMFDLICKKNELVQIDITNSQLAFLSMALRDQLNSNDFKVFQRISILGKLYESIEQLLSLESRKASKIEVLEILFSSRKNSTKTKKELKQHFPNIIKWIDDFKKNNGDKKFSVMLQKLESELMIDGVYMAIKSKGLFCLTKHDSVIVHKENYYEVMAIMKDEFNKRGFQCLLKTTWCYADSVGTYYHPINYVLDPANEIFIYNVPFSHAS